MELRQVEQLRLLQEQNAGAHTAMMSLRIWLTGSQN